jgi:SHS2 domain-containing protein
MKKFEFLDIAPADAAFVAYGKSVEELFANAAMAMMSIIIDPGKVGDTDKAEIEAAGYDLKSLMFDWLNQVLFIVSTENMAFSKFEVQVDEVDGDKNKKYALNAVCRGERIDFERHQFKAEVKAVTYHMMEIKQEGKKWKAQVVVDL